jgi:hypothetical protein
VFNVLWYDPKTGTENSAGTVNGGGSRSVSSPFPGDSVLLLKDSGQTAPPPSPTPVPPGGGPVIKINFQPAGAPTPDGYLVDDGSQYSNRGNGYTYGWDRDNRANLRDREAGSSPNQAYDTFAHMQRSGTFTWKMAMRTGQYQVRVVAGDPNEYDSVYRIQVEGVMVVNGTPSASSPWMDGTVVVNVNDGKLSITNASGSRNNKIAFIEITVLSQASEVLNYSVHLPMIENP